MEDNRIIDMKGFKDSMIRWILFLNLVFFTFIKMLASPSDYGRDYTMREESSNVPLWFVLIVIVGIWISYKLIDLCLSKLDKKTKKLRNQTCTSTSRVPAIKYSNNQSNTICPECEGKGYIKIRTLSDGERCEYCRGYGKELTDRVLQILENIELEKKRRKESTKHLDKKMPGLSDFLCNVMPLDLSLLNEELKKCNICTHCNGKGFIEYEMFWDIDENLNLEEYRRQRCNRCGGLGRL